MRPDLCDEPVQTFQAFTGISSAWPTGSCRLGIKTVAMESTGVYWVPVYEMLEGRGIEVDRWPMRARHERFPAARATSTMRSGCNGCTRAGCCAPASGPARDIAALRAYLRLRERHLDYAAAHIQHMQKALTFMNLQLHHVVSDVTGVTGMKIIRAIVGGERDPDVLAPMRDVRCKASAETVRAALVGNYQPEHVFALAQALALYDFYQARVDDCDAQIEASAGRC